MNGVMTLLRLSRRQWPWLAAGIILGLVVIFANALLMALSGWFIASMALAGAGRVAFDYFAPSALIRALALIRSFGRYGERLVTHEASFRFLADLRVWLFRALAPLAPAGLERYTSGDLAGRLRADVDSLESLYLRVAAPLVTGGAAIVLAILFVAQWDRNSGIALGSALLVVGVALPLLGHRLAREPGREAVVLGGELRASVSEGLQGVEELILSGGAERHAAQVADVSRELVARQERLGRINALTMAGSICCAGLGLAGILVCSGRAVTNGTLTGPALVMLLLFGAAAFEAAGALPGALQALPVAREAMGRLFSLLDTPETVPDPVRPEAVPPGAFDLVFRDVSFSYAGGQPALRNFNLRVPAGSVVTLSGVSGSGKSTLAALLFRFREYSGSITLGGTELRRMSGDSVRECFAVLPQNPHLFNIGIGENILLARPDAGEEEVRRVVWLSGLDEWVAGLPRGLETAVGEGSHFISGGELRRIALARALLKDAPMLILDEPTEGLDPEMEQLILSRLCGAVKGRTVLIISHRAACLAFGERVAHLPECRAGGET